MRSGDVASGKAALSFTNLGVDQGLDYTKTYVLPVTVASNDIDVLSRAKTIYYVVKEASLVNVVLILFGQDTALSMFFYVILDFLCDPEILIL